ncbi:Y-family DNA polymerase [Pseudomonas sp. LA5]|uniref:Y-family DNA polymerase n=1 Tax=Pseudomonas sp. LA5 TaxID=3027850 RepID=UPI00235FC51A|nr:Y-family DNA polymerase [Pseudomonas sp. LA5]
MAESVLALIDCNAFYCSCERVFRPDLAQRPVVVLSNNDGCVIARSAEAKRLGIAMAAPWFQVRELARRGEVEAFSSNYALYGDLSDRVMRTLATLVPRLERYSIDEVFADLAGLPEPLDALGQRLQARVQKWTGIPVSVGIAGTKTLAKLANAAAKRWPARTGGVLDLRDPAVHDWVLKHSPIEDVWGVGRRLAARLRGEGVSTAWELAGQDAWSLRQRYSVVLEKTARELRGLACLSLEELEAPRQTICSSRMFGRRQYQFGALAEAVASYTARAAEKLRAQGSLCRTLRVSIQTGMHGADDGRYANAALLNLPAPSDDTRVLNDQAQAGLREIFRDGFGYAKAEVLLLDLCGRGEVAADLFAAAPDPAAARLMATLDAINGRFGRETLRPARIPRDPAWQMRRDLLSPRYTTRRDELWTVG